MPTDDARRSGDEQLLTGRASAYRWIGARLGAQRAWWVVGALAIAGLAYAVMHLPPTQTGDYAWLYGGKVFPAEDADRILAALKSAGIPCTEADGKVGVLPNRRPEAVALLAKQGIGWRPIADLLDDEPSGGSPLETADQREARARRSRARSAAALIEEIPGIVQAVVVFAPVKTGTAINPSTGLKATAFVQTEDHQRLAQPRVDRIAEILTRFEGVIGDDVSVMDLRSEHVYTIGGRAGNIAIPGRQTRAEELRTRILDRVGIEGAQVSVHVENTEPAPHGVDVAVLNQPLGDVQSEISPAPTPGNEGAARERATVVVQVPRGYFQQQHNREQPGASATPATMSPVVERVRETIRGAVRDSLADAELADLKIAQTEPVEPPTAAESANEVEAAQVVIPPWIPIGGGVALALIVLAALSSGWIAARRATVMRAALPASTRGSSRALEQARAFVLRDQAAAAGVLHAWIEQGSHSR